MIRKLLLLATVALGCLTSPAYGLGLGELELNSALNQQFSAEIELTNVRGLQVEEILPNLASQEDFDRVGVERNYLLTDLRFRVEPNDSGNLVIIVTSSKPIIEPFLNFIVEVLWPTGRILREYTVLLDPPVFGEGGVEAVQPSVSAAPSRTPAASTPAPRRETTRPVQRTTPTPTAAPAPVIQNNTDRQGQITGDEYGMTGQGDTLWNIALRVRPNDSVSVQQTMLALQRANPEAFINNNINLLKAGYVLRIPDVREIREETVASAVREVRVQNQEFDTYKDGSLAQLDATRRQSGDRARDTSSGAGELKLLASSDLGQSGSGDSARAAELENELAVAEEDLDRARRANSELNLKIEDIQNQLDTLNEILTLKDDQIAALRAELQKSQAAPSQSAPVPVQESTSLFSNPFVLGGLGLLLVGVVVGLLLFLKRRQQASAADDEFEEFAEVAAEPEDTDDAELEEEVVEQEEEEENVAPETSDVIGEVEIYIAYGRFPQAITFLQNAIEAEPDRTDIQLKLLEVYVQTEDSVAFNLQLDQLRLLGDQEAIDKALELQQKIPGAAEDAAVAMDATVISMEPVEAIAEPAEDDDDDLSFDLDDLDSETEEDDLDLSLDDELDLDEELDLSLDADDELEVDLGDSGDTVVLSNEELELSLDDSDELDISLDDGEEEISLDLDEDDSLDLDAEIELDLDDSDIELDLEDDEVSLDLDEEIDLDLDTNDTVALEDDVELDLGDSESSSDEIELDLGDDDELSLDLDDDDDVLDLSDLDDDEPLDLEQELESVASELGDDDLEENDDAISLDLDEEIDLDLDLDQEDDGLDLDDEISLDLSEDDEISLDLDDDDGLDLGDDEISLDLDDDDGIELDLDDDGLDLDLDDDGLDLSDDDDNKLDLARAYVDMGDTDGAKSLLEEIVKSGSDEEKQEATEMMEKLDS